MNPFARLQRLLPQPQVYVGRVVAHDAGTDSSVIYLLADQETAAYAAGVQTGARVIARGRSVPVGQNAFVRNGVVESQAPLFENVVEVVIGRVVGP